MSNVPPAHTLSATENPPRRGAPPPSPGGPTSAAEQPFQHPLAVNPETGERSRDEVGGTLSGLATPQPATPVGLPDHAGAVSISSGGFPSATGAVESRPRGGT